jgi:hypothetical protein
MAPTDSAPDASTLRPWQFFTLLALFSATAAVFVVRGTTPANVILICLAIGAAALVGLGALRTLRPLVSAEVVEPEMIGSRTRTALEREKNLLLRAIKELEFDRAMGKVSPADFDEMTARLRARAVRLLKQLDASEGGYREIIERELAARLGKAAIETATVGRDLSPAEVRATVVAPYEKTAEPASSCGTCGTTNDVDARFCKQCGTKLLALLFVVLALATPAWAQFQMPDPKQMSGIPRPVTDLPEGHISVRLIRGQLSNNIADFPVELHAGGKVLTVKTDENGRADFSGIAGGTPVKAVAVVDGERLESQEFPAPTQGGIRLMLVATLKGATAPAPVFQPQPGIVVLGDQTRVIFELGDDALQVYYLLDFQNTARAPVNPPSPVVIDFPAEAQGASVLNPHPQAAVSGRRLTVKGPFAPGQTEIEVGYQIPYSAGELTVGQKFPVGVGNVAVLMKKVGNASVTSPQLPERQEREFQGERYILAQGPPQSAGSTLSLTLSGLPHHSSAPRVIALTLACLSVVLGVWAAARGPRNARLDSARAKQLANKRERIFSELVRLERQRLSGGIEPSRYAERRPALIAQLERVYRDLDTEGGQGLAA